MDRGPRNEAARPLDNFSDSVAYNQDLDVSFKLYQIDLVEKEQKQPRPHSEYITMTVCVAEWIRWPIISLRLVELRRERAKYFAKVSRKALAIWYDDDKRRRHIRHVILSLGIVGNKKLFKQIKVKKGNYII